jgi:hypothetical protein
MERQRKREKRRKGEKGEVIELFFLMGTTHAFAGGILVHKSRRQKEFKWS